MTDYTEALAKHGPPFFRWTQPNPVALGSHYTATRAIAKLRTSLSGHWHGGDYQPLYFADAGAAPAIPPSDTTDYHSAANAFVCQAIHNGDSAGREACNWPATQATIDVFNQKLWDENFDRYIDWFGWDASIQVTGAHCTYQEYYDAITDPFWVGIKKAQQVDGTWPNQSIEMFTHFLKLRALGASDAQIETVYNVLTAPSDPNQPSLAAGGFGDITPSTYKTYRAYLFPGSVSFSQLSVLNLNSRTEVWGPYIYPGGQNIVTLYADQEFLHETGYWQDPPSGCCFAAGTQVVLADGVTTKPIDQIKPGDEVLSPTRDDEDTVRKCLFLSQPARNGRSLFSYTEHNGIQFTATHPLLLGYDESGDALLGFVDVPAAKRANPTWAAFEMVSIPQEDLVQIASAEVEGAEEVLNDIIFDDDDKKSTGGLATYVVQGRNGKRMVVGSESPDSLVLPDVTAFIVAFLTGISQHANASGFFPHGLTTGAIDYSARFRKLRGGCIAELENIIVSDTNSGFRKGDLSTIFSSSPMSFQAILDSIEALIISTGLSIQAELDNIWIHRHRQQKDIDSNAEYTVISSHFIGLNHDVARNSGIVTSVLEGTDDNLNIRRHNISDTGGTIEENRGATAGSKVLSSKKIGPYLHRHHAVTWQPKQKPGDFHSLEVALNGLHFVANGHLNSFHGGFMKWPLYMHNSTTLSHVGWIGLTAENVDTKTLEYIERIAPETYAGTVQAYARALGESLGMNITSDIK
ncbi:hypothetical protein Dda_1886 [Drechslerella dactyloides]|uniref:Hint domain-containing protein n=1 Tax=Drechslerella dactyloides TaxID=74499 RepID=A0AAD6J2H4_DREDA|nr:hypothetical protein Dda_1886 [Drechslerella dactyloides]